MAHGFSTWHAFSVSYCQAFDELSDGSMLVMASDGLWDVLSNADVHGYFQGSSKVNSTVENAKGLVMEARGHQVPDGFWEKKNGDLASGDDITCITVAISDVKKALMKTEK